MVPLITSVVQLFAKTFFASTIKRTRITHNLKNIPRGWIFVKFGSAMHSYLLDNFQKHIRTGGYEWVFLFKRVCFCATTYISLIQQLPAFCEWIHSGYLLTCHISELCKSLSQPRSRIFLDAGRLLSRTNSTPLPASAMSTCDLSPTETVRITQDRKMYVPWISNSRCMTPSDLEF